MSFSCLSPHHRDEWLKVAWDLLGYSVLHSTLESKLFRTRWGFLRAELPTLAAWPFTHPSRETQVRLQGEQT